MPFNGMHKGTPQSEAWKQKMDAAKRQRREAAEAAARAALGHAAPQEQIDKYVREAQRASRQANAAQREQKRQQKIAQDNLRAAASVAGGPNMGSPATQSYAGTATLPPPPPRAYEAPPMPSYTEVPSTPQSHDDLYNHPIFGSVSQPEGVASVAVYRLPSDMPEHRGVTPGYLQSMSFDEFSEDAIRVNHGGGKYRAVAKDARGRVIRSGDFTISGRAKLFTPTEEEMNARANSRVSSVFRAEGEDIPTPYRLYMEQSDKRMERLEALIEAQLAGSKQQPTDEDKLDKWKRELEAKEELEQKRHERRLAEIKAEMEAQNAKETARLNAAQQSAQAASAQQMEFMKAIVQSQSGVNQTLMTALVANKDHGSGTEKFFLPMIQGMSEMMKAQNGTWGQLVSVLKDSMGGEDQRTTGTRILDMIEKGVGSLWDKAGDGLLMQIVSKLGQPKENAVPQSIPEGSAFQLPDGRVVPPEVCAQFVARYRQLHGVNPSLEVCVAAFVEIMNQQAAQPQQPAQIAGPTAQSQPQQPQVQVTQEQAEEFVRQAQQKAAEEATRAGKTPEEVQAAAKQAAQQAVLYLRSLIAGQRPAQPAQTPASATAAPPAATSVPAPAPAAVAAAAQAAHAPQVPQPAPAAIAAAQAATAAAPTATATVQAGPVQVAPTATATVQAGPITPPGSVTIPWMHRGFLQFAIDAFQARQNPIDFLFLAMQQGKISPDAKLMIGRIYEDSGDDEELKGILTKVGGLLVQRGVNMPETFLTTFGTAPEGESWLETFLFACSCSSRDEALTRLKEEG